MHSSQAACSDTGTRKTAVPARSRSKKASAAPDPCQPTLREVLARVAVKPSHSASQTADVQASVADQDRSLYVTPPAAHPANGSLGPCLNGHDDMELPGLPAAPEAPWSRDLEVISLRRKSAADPAPTALSASLSLSQAASSAAQYGSCSPGALPQPSPPAARAPAAGHAVGASSAGFSTRAGDPAATHSSGQDFCSGGAGLEPNVDASGSDSDDGALTLADRLARMRLGRAPQHRSGAGPRPAPPPAPPQPPRPQQASRPRALSDDDDDVILVETPPVAQAQKPARKGRQCAEVGSVMEAPRPTAAAAVTGAASEAVVMGKGAATPLRAGAAEEKAPGAKARGRTRTKQEKPARSGCAPDGSLLWTELTPAERAEAGGSWIRWEPRPRAQAEGADGPLRIYHLFSVDVETVDFMRGPQSFPRPDQARLIEVAAVDMGPVGEANAPLGPAPADGARSSNSSSNGVLAFSTLVNCGKPYKDHKTAKHNQIKWAESGAPGVPHTAQALERLFSFIQERCSASAAAAAASAAAAAAAAAEEAAAAAGEAAARAAPPRSVEVVPVLMAHNGAGFDFPVMRCECARVGVEWPQDWWYLDTLVMSKVLWATADKPRLPVDAAGAGEVEAEEVEELGEEGTEPGTSAPKDKGKTSLSMEALKLWAGVVSSGESHRALIDAEDLAALWPALCARFGRPSLTQLEALCGKAGKTMAAGPMHRLGLLSLAAKTDGLRQHMAAAVARHFGAPRPPAFAGPAPPPPPTPAAAAALLVTPAELRELASAGRLSLRASGGGGDFRVYSILAEGTGAPAPGSFVAPSSSSSVGQPGVPSQEPGPAQHAQRAPQGPPLRPLVVLLRGAKLQYFTRGSYAYKDDHKPKWDMRLLPAPVTKDATGPREGTAGPQDISDLVRVMDVLAKHAYGVAHGSDASAPQLTSCGKEDAKKKQLGVSVQLHAHLTTGPARGQLGWEVLTTMATYNKKSASYMEQSWPPLKSYVAAPGGAGGFRDPELEQVKEDNVASVGAQLPDVASSELLDVAVWPQFCWVNKTGCGVRLTALHIVRRPGRGA